MHYRSMTFHWVIILESKQQKMQPMYLTQLGGTQWSGLGRHSAQLLRGSQTHWWCMEETMARNWWPSGLSSTPWKSFTFWLTRTQFRSLLMLSSTGIEVWFFFKTLWKFFLYIHATGLSMYSCIEFSRISFVAAAVVQGKTLPALDLLVLLGVRQLIFPHCAVWIKQSICSPLVLVNLLSVISRLLRNVWPMNSLMLPRVHLTGK